ncbi:HsdM family class I SAM-dependent methyltransferase [Anabaenopsis elenkinii]|uniref:site-specific DNA-methyltransferase (adenine-specific) n=1 Tax=Anabaenopsis elenkinii CCIBt3563 TaxID=2779889 RepID=A0A7S6U4W7_9CYAN|nr:N-6 DNA methylase [Anabaenopsis elenkinii]QOV23641.1 N-6 DNA methylase [Anabaenopsis elenkinii CCIBt3563]
MVVGRNSVRELLEAAYSSLNFQEGELLATDTSPTNLTLEQWIEKGDWLSLGKQVGAEKIFFVNSNPVIVFAGVEETEDDEVLRRVFNKIWCMARPQYLFLAKQGELAVYDLTKPPSKTIKEWQDKESLAVARTTAEVASKLYQYRREQIESGRLFEDQRFGKDNQRADQSLIQDLKTVRFALMDEGLKGDKLKYAHSLIGRSIFIRYLEDRGILSREYFEEIAQENSQWQTLLNTPDSPFNLEPEAKQFYIKILGSKDFTYAVFERLSSDFNGDMFPSDTQEKQEITADHLKLLQSFLMGDVSSQKKLFFWAYKFQIIPISLISSIYEEFYHQGKEESDDFGTHYTPSSLVEYLLSKVLTSERLNTNPRVIDPCCGSGIFLVESFRRIIRHHVYKSNGRRLSADRMRDILRDQIAGIEINEEAIRITSFSLYLALLHYQEAPDILEQIKNGKHLPNLIYQDGWSDDKQHFNNLLRANTFDIASAIKNNNEIFERFNSNCADVVVGNPPWGSSTIGWNTIAKWCKTHKYPVGDKERSQAFIWRVLDLLRDNASASLLVSTGVFLKTQTTSKAFRREWLSKVEIKEVINFAHVRDVFFRRSTEPNKKHKKSANSSPTKSKKSAIAPFASVLFCKKSDAHTPKNYVVYWSAKKTAMVKELQAVILSVVDRHVVRQADFLSNETLWKIYWWGSHRDVSLISAIKNLYTPLRFLHDSDNSGQGFTKSIKETKPSDWLLKYKELPVKYFNRYGTLETQQLIKPPLAVKRKGKPTFYQGDRLLIKRGINQSSDMKGQIIARMESARFCFSNSINCIKLLEPQSWKYKVILGILWSSLPRYYFFLTCSEWGIWHYEIYKDEYLNLPIALPTDKSLRERIIQIVEELQTWNPVQIDEFVLGENAQEKLQNQLMDLEFRLDEAIFDLYDLNISERDLIRDMCDVGIDFFYKHSDSQAVQSLEITSLPKLQGTIADISKIRSNQNYIQAYIYTFLNIWNRELEPDGEFNWKVISAEENSSMLAVVFSTQEKNISLPYISNSSKDEWKEILASICKDNNGLLSPYNSHQIYIDGMVRVVTDTQIIIIKRNEIRLWTRSMAREDAEATLLQAIHLQETIQGDGGEVL